MMSVLHENDQTKIWDHFQGAGVSSFDRAVPRLRYLFARARHLGGGNTWRVLNIGTGNGWLERACQTYGWDSKSLDPSMVALQKIGRYGISGQVGMIEHAPYQDESFDVIFSSEVFEHLTADQLAAGLREIARMLRSGGYLIGTVPFNEDLASGETVCPHCGEIFHRWGHQQSFTTTSMRILLEGARFRMCEVSVRAFPYFSHRSPLNLTKMTTVKLAGRLGFPSAYPSLCFIAQKGQP